MKDANRGNHKRFILFKSFVICLMTPETLVVSAKYAPMERARQKLT